MAGTMSGERRNHIIQQLLLNKRISAKELAEKFNVSTETIRKDLIRLEKEGLAKKGYGGAVAANAIFEVGFMEKMASHPAEKAMIAQRAAGFARPGFVILLDNGSTTYEVAKQLALLDEITVYTNSIRAAQLLADAKRRVVVLGGEIREASQAVVGGWAEKQLAEIRADVAFLGTSGFRDRGGPCVENLPESAIKKAMIAGARRTVVVADSSKADQDATVRFAAWRDIDALVSDKNFPKVEVARLGKLTEVVLA